MPKYTGNLYTQPDVAANTQKALPSSLFGTRQLKFFSFQVYYDLYSDVYNSDEVEITVTGGTADGTHVTYTFADQGHAPYAYGDTIFIYNMDYIKYDGEFTVVACTSTSVTVNWFATGDTVVGGYITRAGYNNPDSFYSNIVRAIQKVAEIYYLGSPTYTSVDNDDYGSFVFGISDELTTSDINYSADTSEEDGYSYPTGPGAGEVTPGTMPTDLASALDEFMNSGYFGNWGPNGDGWQLTTLEDLGWGLMPNPITLTGGNPPSPSDIRLKRNIELLETRNGVKIYSFQYLWSDEYFVGVMAQDLLGTEHESAVILRNGFYTVDYSQLGFNMMLLSDYNSLTV